MQCALGCVCGGAVVGCPRRLFADGLCSMDDFWQYCLTINRTDPLHRCEPRPFLRFREKIERPAKKAPSDRASSTPLLAICDSKPTAPTPLRSSAKLYVPEKLDRAYQINLEIEELQKQLKNLEIAVAPGVRMTRKEKEEQITSRSDEVRALCRKVSRLAAEPELNQEQGRPLLGSAPG